MSRWIRYYKDGKDLWSRAGGLYGWTGRYGLYKALLQRMDQLNGNAFNQEQLKSIVFEYIEE